jgi:hypothetical protein
MIKPGTYKRKGLPIYYQVIGQTQPGYYHALRIDTDPLGNAESWSVQNIRLDESLIEPCEEKKFNEVVKSYEQRKNIKIGQCYREKEKDVFYRILGMGPVGTWDAERYELVKNEKQELEVTGHIIAAKIELDYQLLIPVTHPEFELYLLPASPIEIDHDCTDVMVCPYCGHKHDDSWELKMNEGEYQCNRCERVFVYSRETRVTYSTEKLEDNRLYKKKMEEAAKNIK